ncbi:CRYAB.2 family protein [Megaselia abdita]
MFRQCFKVVVSQFPRNFNRLARPNPIDEFWRMQKQIMSTPFVFPKIMLQHFNDFDRKYMDAFQDKDHKENIIYDKVKGLQIKMDVSQFKPKELTVKTINDYIVVEGKHEEVQDEHGSIQRHFVRKYQLPEGLDEKLVRTTLSPDGILCVSAPPVGKSALENERVIPIEETEAIEDKNADEGQKK